MLRSGALGHLECQLRGTCHVHVFLRKLCSHLGCSIMCRRHPVVVEKTERTSSESLYSAFLARPCHMKKKTQSHCSSECWYIHVYSVLQK